MTPSTPTGPAGPDTPTPAEVIALVRRVREELGEPAAAPHDADADVLLAAARERLEARLTADPPPRRAAAGRAAVLLGEVDRLRRRRRDAAASRELSDVRRVLRGIDVLRDRDDVAAMIDAAPAALARSCDFGRGMISAVAGSVWLPRTLHVEEDGARFDAFRTYLADARIPLHHQLLETELVRRRIPALVSDAVLDRRTFKTIVHAAQSSSYVVAPVVARGHAIGFLHADRVSDDAPVTDADRDRIALFASAFGLVHEQAVLRDRLRTQRERSRAAFARTEAVLERLERSAIELDEALTPQEADRIPATGPMPGRARVAALLTPREHEVLELMSEGATNTRIAEQLVISEGTVKSHVKHILRKLRAPTRAAAVARYAHIAQRSRQAA